MVKICNTNIYSDENDAKYAEYFASFGFPLSPFQKYAIEAIVEGHHVLVTAHTGSGKTLPAEFAIQHFVKGGKRLIYTSPIKALSNQKYYEFSKKYSHISFGLLTGDIKTNPEADVLIMTTEILMNALFRKTTGGGSGSGSGTEAEAPGALAFTMNIDTELGCVVFDEVHYINDADRGQVWEKTILMLPPHIQMVMLSATIDAPDRFAEWCERGGLGEKQVYLASTSHRIVPLTHYGFLTVTENLFKGMKDKALEKDVRENTNQLITLRTDRGQYMESGYKDLKRILGVFEDRDVFLKRKAVLNNLAQFLRDREMLPAIAFVFSRKHVELCAKEITVPLLEFDSKVAYTVARECEQIVRKLPNFREYLELPEYQSLVALLEKGIGIHHSGMIPILREIVELMISKKYIKLLFATESFAIGLDCPIKTAIFTSLTKYDGSRERYLLSHEYTQMAGRAGRRGIDQIGHVIHCNNLFTLPSSSEYNSILCGSPQKLVSKFRISYSIILGYLGKTDEPVSLNTFVQFVEKSMILNEIAKEKAQQTRVIGELAEQIAKKCQTVELLQTPAPICREYLEIEIRIKTVVNKKRKELERQMQKLKDQYRHIVDNCKIVKEYDILVSDLAKETAGLADISGYITDQVKNVVDILIGLGFVEEIGGDTYAPTYLGKMAADVAEIHPIVFIQLLQHTDRFAQFSPKQLVGLFSCFTDIKVAQDMRMGVPNSKDSLLQKTVEKMDMLFNNLADIEYKKSMNTGINYNDVLMYDLVDLIAEWCECDTEQNCKYYIQQVLGEKGISVGDFSKGILKIATITKEIGALCEKYGQIELQHKLASIEPMILKYITTAQSLYV
jgi:superfamily II RNA helicase